MQHGIRLIVHMDILTKRLQLPRRDLALFQFILEGYEGMSAIQTLDARSGVVQIQILPGFIQETAAVLEELLAELQGIRYTT